MDAFTHVNREEVQTTHDLDSYTIVSTSLSAFKIEAKIPLNLRDKFGTKCLNKKMVAAILETKDVTSYTIPTWIDFRLCGQGTQSVYVLLKMRPESYGIQNIRWMFFKKCAQPALRQLSEISKTRMNNFTEYINPSNDNINIYNDDWPTFALRLDRNVRPMFSVADEIYFYRASHGLLANISEETDRIERLVDIDSSKIIVMQVHIATTISHDQRSLVTFDLQKLNLLFGPSASKMSVYRRYFLHRYGYFWGPCRGLGPLRTATFAQGYERQAHMLPVITKPSFTIAALLQSACTIDPLSPKSDKNKELKKANESICETMRKYNTYVRSLLRNCELRVELVLTTNWHSENTPQDLLDQARSTPRVIENELFLSNSIVINKEWCTYVESTALPLLNKILQTITITNDGTETEEFSGPITRQQFNDVYDNEQLLKYFCTGTFDRTDAKRLRLLLTKTLPTDMTNATVTDTLLKQAYILDPPQLSQHIPMIIDNLPTEKIKDAAQLSSYILDLYGTYARQSCGIRKEYRNIATPRRNIFRLKTFNACKKHDTPLLSNHTYSIYDAVDSMLYASKTRASAAIREHAFKRVLYKDFGITFMKMAKQLIEVYPLKLIHGTQTRMWVKIFSSGQTLPPQSNVTSTATIESIKMKRLRNLKQYRDEKKATTTTTTTSTNTTTSTSTTTTTTSTTSTTSSTSTTFTITSTSTTATLTTTTKLTATTSTSTTTPFIRKQRNPPTHVAQWAKKLRLLVDESLAEQPTPSTSTVSPKGVLDLKTMTYITQPAKHNPRHYKKKGGKKATTAQPTTAQPTTAQPTTAQTTTAQTTTAQTTTAQPTIPLKLRIASDTILKTNIPIHDVRVQKVADHHSKNTDVHIINLDTANSDSASLEIETIIID